MRQWLIDVRTGKMLRQLDVAKAVGITRGFYTQIETGTRTPSPKVAKRLAAFLEIEWTRFFD